MRPARYSIALATVCLAFGLAGVVEEVIRIRRVMPSCVPLRDECWLTQANSCTFCPEDPLAGTYYFYVVLQGEGFDITAVADALQVENAGRDRIPGINREQMGCNMRNLYSCDEGDRFEVYSLDAGEVSRGVRVVFGLAPQNRVKRPVLMGMTDLQSQKGWGIQRDLRRRTGFWWIAGFGSMCLAGILLLVWTCRDQQPVVKLPS